MKRCPECQREYVDETLNFCLDDGAWLREVENDEPATALQSFAEKTIDPSASGKRTIEETVILPERSYIEDVQRPVSSAEYLIIEARKHRGMTAVAAVAILVVIVGFGYFYLKSSTTPLTPSPIASIAVLPFQNKNSDPDTDYLSDGLAESLIFRLTQLPGLKVSPTSSVMRYKSNDIDVAKVAGDLGVEAVMTGRLVKRGDNLNITVELVDTRNNRSLWGEQYERRMSDLLATQREIAATIAQKLQLKLASDEKGVNKHYTDNNDAYQLYLNGRFHFAKRTKEDLYKSIDLFQQAIELDPNFALAYVGVAESYTVIPSFPYASPAECVPKAKAAAQKALDLDPNLPEAHTVTAMIAATYDWDWATAEREFKRALEIDPDLALTHYRYAWTFLSPLGRHDQAIAEMRKAMELEPLSLIQGANYAGVLLYARRHDEAIAQAKKTFDLDPGFFGGKSWLSHSYNAAGKYAEALAIAEPTLNSDSPFISDAAIAYAKSGQRDRALALIERWKEAEKQKYVMNYWFAMSYAALGDKDAAFAELEKAYQNHDWFLQRIKVDPFADPLRDDPRFNEMVKRLKFPD
jgi:TolB-like protein/Flp pilus assembly protein TadD